MGDGHEGSLVGAGRSWPPVNGSYGTSPETEVFYSARERNGVSVNGHTTGTQNGEGDGGAVKIAGPAQDLQERDSAFEKKCAAAKNEVDKIEREASRAAGAAVDAEDKTTEHAEYVRIKNILDVKNNPVYSSAFEEWNRQLKEQRIKLVDKEKEKTDVTTQVYNIVGFFSVFQGVVLTAVSQLASGSQPKCGKAWFPIVLSVFATVVALVALYKKYVALKGLEDSSIEFRDLRDEFSKRVETLLTKGKNFKFCKDLKEPGPSKLEHNFWLFKICTLVALLLFTGIFVLSYLVILCDRFLT